MNFIRSFLATTVLALSTPLLLAQPLKPVTVASGLVNPWGLAFLPDRRMLVTERAGRVRIVGADGRLGAPLAGLPKIEVAGQGGLLDVAIGPAFAENGFMKVARALGVKFTAQPV